MRPQSSRQISNTKYAGHGKRTHYQSGRYGSVSLRKLNARRRRKAARKAAERRMQ